MKMKLYSYLRNRSLFSRMYHTNLLVATVPLLVVTIVFSLTLLTSSINWFRSKEQASLYYYADNISNELYHFDNAIVSLTQDDTFQNCLNHFITMNSYEKYETAVNLSQLVSKQFHMLDYVTDIVMVSNNYETVQLYGGPHGDFYLDKLDLKSILKQTFSEKNNTWIGDTTDYCLNDAWNSSGFVYAKRITDSNTNSTNIGYILAYLDKETFFNLSMYSSFKQNKKESQFIVDESGYIIHSNLVIEESYTNFSDILSEKISATSSSSFLSKDTPSRKLSFHIYYKLPSLDWYIVSSIPITSIISSIFWILFLMAVLIIMIIFVQTFLSGNIAYSIEAPVKELHACLQRIENGDFSTGEDTPYMDELAQVQNSLNYTTALLEQLFLKTKQHEREKYDLQFQALMSQMNPHFLMNSLNSVMLLANVQGADNIKNLCQALIKLFQDILNSKSVYTSLMKDLELLDAYALIMQYRYFSRFQLEYKIDVDARKTKLPRFLLQPLIENALNHAMDDSIAFLTIQLHAFIKDNHLYLCVSDNGIGIPQNILAQLNSSDYWMQEHKDEGKHIGLWNINRRIQLIYGASYGLTIKSVINQGTSVTICLPNDLSVEEKEHEIYLNC